VQKFKVGDKVGLGGQVGSCGKCEICTDGSESYCPEVVLIDGSAFSDGNLTMGNTSGHMGTDDDIDAQTSKLYGGLCNIVVADENFMIHWPENFPLDIGPPLLCAGITTYSPLRHFGLDKPGLHIGVVGLGGLGHLAVKFAKAFGAKVTAISTSNNKKQDAIEKFGADSFLLSNSHEQMQVNLSHLKNNKSNTSL
jgi:D-arabinose 1-dehydrogenase-like Zn-dependent alcohol dehydrogenase